MTTTLVTGAAGFAGSHLLDLLAADGGQTPGSIVAWHRGTLPSSARRDAAIHWEAVDVLDRDAVRSAVARTRPSTVYHCAGAAHVGRAWDDIESTFATNVRGTHNMLDALARAGVRARMLIPSSALVYTPADRPLAETDRLVPSSPYGVSKLAQELLASHSGSGLIVTVARAFNHVGPRQDPHFAAADFARRIADIERGRWQPEITVGNLEARRDLTDVRDTVRAYRLIVERGVPGRPYNVCTGRAIAIGDLLDRLLSRARVKITIRPDPARLRPNDTPVLVGDPGRAHDELGWAPAIPLDRALDDLLDYWRGRAQ